MIFWWWDKSMDWYWFSFREGTSKALMPTLISLERFFCTIYSFAFVYLFPLLFLGKFNLLMSRLLSRAIRVFFFEVTPLCWLVMAGTSKGTKPAHKVRNQRVPSCVIFFTRNWERPLYTMHTMCFGVILSDVFTDIVKWNSALVTYRSIHCLPNFYSFRLKTKTITKNWVGSICQNLQFVSLKRHNSLV